MPSNISSKFGTMYHGMLNRKPTPRISKPHIRMKTSRSVVFTFDRPPVTTFFWKMLENQSAMLTANKQFIIAAASITRTAKNDPVK